jgi:hypothetical protein
MSRRELTFRQNDVARAVKGAVAGGLTVQRIEVDKAGKIIVVVGDADQATATTTGEAKEWDRI